MPTATLTTAWRPQLWGGCGEYVVFRWVNGKTELFGGWEYRWIHDQRKKCPRRVFASMKEAIAKCEELNA